MFSVVFWNIGQKRTADGIVRLITAAAREHSADVFALAECSDGVLASTLRALNPLGRPPEYGAIRTSSRVRVVFRGAVTAVSEVSAHTYYSILRVDLTPRPEVLVVAAHMVSLLEKDRHDIDQELEAMSAAVREAEGVVGHSRTILVGDLNSNPFDSGVASARGLHGVMSRAVAGRDTRRVSYRDYPMFFNPMWGFFGDDERRATGTYFREGGGGHLVYYWHMYDQVLIRPALLPCYRQDSVQIITCVGGTRLTRSDWRPDRDVGSDHLPVRVQLDH